MGVGELLVVRVDGTTERIPNTYESIKEGLNGATLDFRQIIGGAGLYVDDEGMLDGRELNVAASLLAQFAVYGPVVLCNGEPDDEGETLPPNEHAAKTFEIIGAMWQAVVADARRKGQVPYVCANPDTVPPATVVGLTEEQFMHYLSTGELPNG